MSTQQKILDIEAEVWRSLLLAHIQIARTQKNKATNAHIGLLKARLAKLKRDLISPSSGGGGGKCEGRINY